MGKSIQKERIGPYEIVVKEFYAKMTVIHLKKKDIVKSKKLATILGIHGNNGIREYVKDVWEESKYIKPLEITGRFANNETLTATRRVRSIEMKPFRRFVHFIVMKNIVPRFGKRDTTSFMDLTYMDHPGEEPKKYDFFEDTFLTMCKLTGENGIWWIGSGENRRRDDDEATQEEEAEGEDEGNRVDFGREAIIDEATVEGESGSGEKFYDAEEDAQGSPELPDEIPADATPSSVQAEFERKRANKFHDELEKAKAENAKLLALLHQAQTKPHP
ncbi:hypothetical protein Dimus_029498 [Dionaea muscipula]